MEQLRRDLQAVERLIRNRVEAVASGGAASARLLALKAAEDND
jgi:hypothetical protein